MRTYRVPSYSPNVASFTAMADSSLARSKNIKPNIAAAHARSELLPPPGLSIPNRYRLYPKSSVLKGNRRFTFLLDIDNHLIRISHRAPTFVKSFLPPMMWGNITPLTFPLIVEAFNPKTSCSLSIKFIKFPPHLSSRLPIRRGRGRPRKKIDQALPTSPIAGAGSLTERLREYFYLVRCFSVHHFGIVLFLRHSCSGRQFYRAITLRCL